MGEARDGGTRVQGHAEPAWESNMKGSIEGQQVEDGLGVVSGGGAIDGRAVKSQMSVAYVRGRIQSGSSTGRKGFEGGSERLTRCRERGVNVGAAEENLTLVSWKLLLFKECLKYKPILKLFSCELFMTRAAQGFQRCAPILVDTL